MITVKEIKDAISELHAVDIELDTLAAKVKKLNEEKSGLKAKLTLLLKEVGERNFTCELGTVTKITDYSVKMPAGDDKQKFFEFLKERGVFDELATINYQTLNAYYKEQWEIAKQEDAASALNFSLPGIGELKAFETIKFRKK